MPTYEYECNSCGNEFTEVKSVEEHDRDVADHKVHCPKCNSDDVKHVIESVFVTTSSKS